MHYSHNLILDLPVTSSRLLHVNVTCKDEDPGKSKRPTCICSTAHITPDVVDPLQDQWRVRERQWPRQ